MNAAPAAPAAPPLAIAQSVQLPQASIDTLTNEAVRVRARLDAARDANNAKLVVELNHELKDARADLSQAHHAADLSQARADLSQARALAHEFQMAKLAADVRAQELQVAADAQFGLFVVLSMTLISGDSLLSNARV